MRAVVFGASGSIGTAITRELLDRGHEVTGVTRTGSPAAPGAMAVTGDASDPHTVASLVNGADVVISAVGPRHDGSEDPSALAATMSALVQGMREAGAKRLVVVGGAGSLLDSHGKRHVDDPHFPAAVKPIALAHAAALDVFRAVDDLDWTYVSPAATIEQGERTGAYRTGGDHLLTDASGISRITVSDYALALVDEVENPTAIRRRVTFAY